MRFLKLLTVLAIELKLLPATTACLFKIKNKASDFLVSSVVFCNCSLFCFTLSLISLTFLAKSFTCCESIPSSEASPSADKFKSSIPAIYYLIYEVIL